MMVLLACGFQIHISSVTLKNQDLQLKVKRTTLYSSKNDFILVFLSKINIFVSLHGVLLMQIKG